MREDIYQFLHDYGFSSIELDKIEDRNENIFFTSIHELRKNLIFLEEKCLDLDDIINLVNDNPFMLTEKTNRLEAIDEIYARIGFDSDSLKKILRVNSRTYTLSPVELSRIIDFLKSMNYSIQTIRDVFVKNPMLLSMKFDEFKRLYKKQ
jgi:hypothetical protein